jgi:hypothetical protein
MSAMGDGAAPRAGTAAAVPASNAPERRRLRLPTADEPAARPGGLAARFIDYLYLGFTNALAFSPTDTVPLVPWAKVAMAVQSMISLAILGLVVARAVNVFA